VIVRVSVKSAAFASVSVVPCRTSASGVPFAPDGFVAGAASEVFEVPYPSRSTTPGVPVATAPTGRVSAARWSERTSVPLAPEAFSVETTSGVGSAAPTVPFEAPCTR
jgi:hypothetical protein